MSFFPFQPQGRWPSWQTANRRRKNSSVNNDNAQNTKAEVVDHRLFPKPQGLQGLLPKGFQGGEALLLEGVHQGVPLPVRFLLGTDGEEAEGGGEVPPVVQKGVFPSGG